MFQKILKVASQSELHQKHGAGILQNSNHLNMNFIGCNHYSKTPYSDNDISIHAEIASIDKFIRYCQLRGLNDSIIRRKLKKIVLLICRLANDGNGFTHSFPCINCLNTIKTYGITKILVSDNLGNFQLKKAKYNRY